MTTLIAQAEAAHRQGNLVEAARLYTSQLQSNEQDVDALYGLGTLAMQEGRTIEALPLLEQAAAIEPDAGEIAYNYAICLHRSGDMSAAVKVAEQAAACSGADESFSLMVCRLLLLLNAPQLVLKQMSRFQHVDLPSAILHAHALGALGEWGRAVANLRQLLQDHQNSPELARELSLAAASLRDYALAIDSYAHYLSLISPGADDFVKFADLYLLAREPAQCAANLQRAAELGTDTADFHLLQARLARLNGDYVLAEQASEATLAHQPDHGQAWSVRFEIAPLAELPALIMRLQTSLDIDKVPPYHQQLLEYVLADAHARLEEFTPAFSYYVSANSRQKANLRAGTGEYDVSTSQSNGDSIRRQFNQPTQTASVLSDRATPLFILGMPRSGTTLVERMLAQLPMVTAGGENEALGFLATQYQLDVNAGKYPVPTLMMPKHWDKLALRYFDKTLRYQALPVTRDTTHFVTDKMPQNFHHVGMILSLFPSAHIIQMRRDPRDVCWSIYTRMFPDGHSYSCDLAAVAHAYHVSRQLMDHWARLSPTRVIDVNYEALVADPVVQGQRITDFCDLPWHKRCLDFHKDITPSFTFSELQVRQAINVKRIGRWQPYTEQLKPLFNALQEFGYLDEPVR